MSVSWKGEDDPVPKSLVLPSFLSLWSDSFLWGVSLGFFFLIIIVPTQR